MLIENNPFNIPANVRVGNLRGVKNLEVRRAETYVPGLFKDPDSPALIYIVLQRIAGIDFYHIFSRRT